MQFDIQRIRNLTTGRLHTSMAHVYEDLEAIIGDKGFMTHMLPRLNETLQPFLHFQIEDQRFFDKKFDITHTGVVEIESLTKEQAKIFWETYATLPNPLTPK